MKIWFGGFVMPWNNCYWLFCRQLINNLKGCFWIGMFWWVGGHSPLCLLARYRGHAFLYWYWCVENPYLLHWSWRHTSFFGTDSLEIMPDSLWLLFSEATLPLLRLTGITATPPSPRLMGSYATPPSLELTVSQAMIFIFFWHTGAKRRHERKAQIRTPWCCEN